MHDWKFYFYGIGAEYSLRPLCEYMQKNNFDCVELDPLQDDIFEKLKNDKTSKKYSALISSQHFYYGRNGRVNSRQKDFLSLLEMFAILRPNFTVFAPHDLFCPVHQDEVPFLNILDLYLAAEERERIFEQYCPVEVIGWIPSMAEDIENFELYNNGVWLISGAPFLSGEYGSDVVSEIIARQIKNFCSVKIASWFNAEEIENKLRAQGVHVIPSHIPASAVIRQSSFVITNGPSSVAREAFLFKKPLFLLLDEMLLLPSDKKNLWKLFDLPNFCGTFSQAAVLARIQEGIVEPSNMRSEQLLKTASEAILRHLPKNP